MAVFSGKDGKLQWGNTDVTRVRNWALQSTLDTLEVTDLGDDARAYVPGLKSATGTATIFYHDDDTTLQKILDNIILTGTPSSGVLDLSWGTKNIEMRVYITSANITCAAGEVMTADVSFQMTDDYRIATL